MMRLKSILTFVTVVVLVIAFSSAEEMTPILFLPGEHPVVLLMDVQASAVGRDLNSHPNSDVNSDVNKVVPVLLGAVNTVEKMRVGANVSLGEFPCQTFDTE